MKNLVLIGLSGCGKSTLGRKLSKSLRMPLLDTDAMIEAAAGCSVGDIFARRGEPCFRDLEAEACRAAAGQHGVIIATGGGAVLREENMTALRASGVLFFIDRHPAQILRAASLEDRPLVAGDAQKLFRLYAERLPLYRRWADATIPNRGSRRYLARSMRQIMRRFKKAV